MNPPSTTARFNCPVSTLLDTLSKRWTLLILHQIANGIRTFNALKRALGQVSSRTLNERLKELEANNFLERRIVSERPIKIEYHLTRRGDTVKQALCDLERLARES